jgi:hypothetical protein
VVSAALESNNTSAVPEAIGTDGTPLHGAVKNVAQNTYSEIVLGSASPVCGLARVAVGNGRGTWVQVNNDLQPVSFPKLYFEQHPVYAGISAGRCIVDGQIMQRIPKVYHKYVVPSAGALEGRLVRLIAPEAADGFAPMPAFVTSGGELEQFWLGTYAGIDDGGDKVGSLPGKKPLVDLSFDVMRARCEARNVDGVAGFRLWDVYQASVIQTLAAIEFGVTDMQMAIGRGRVDTSSANYVDEADVSQATWRGLVGLWGNVWQMVDGLRCSTSGYLEVFARDGSRAYVPTNYSAARL